MRAILSLCMLAVLFSAGFAAYNDYSVNLQVLPGEAYENNEVIVFGYLSISDWGKIVSPDSLRLKIQKSDVIVKDYSINDINYINDINDSSKLVDGFFYRRINDLPAGDYLVGVFIDGEQVSNYKVLKVLPGNANMTVKGLGFTNNAGPSFELNYSGSLASVNADVYLYGRSNIDSPAVFSYGLTKGVAYTVLGVDGFTLSDYVGSEQVYGMVVYASSADGSSSTPYVLVRNTGFKSSVYDAVLSLAGSSVKKGSSVSVPFSVTNNGSLLSTYSVQLSGSLSDYVSGPATVEVMPGRSVNGNLVINVPRSYLGTSGSINVDLKVGDLIVESRNVVFTLTPADKTHSIILGSVNFTKDSYFVGEKVRGVLTLVNDGDFNENVRITYYFDGSEQYKTSASIPVGSSVNVSFVTATGSSNNLVVLVENDFINYASSRAIPSIMEKEFSFRFFAEINDLISRDKSVDNFVVVLENTGNVWDDFIITSMDYDYLVINNTPLPFIATLMPGQSIVVNVTADMPVNQELLNFTLSACSQVGNSCEYETLRARLFTTPEPLVELPSKINVTSSASDSGSLIYSFAVKNQGFLSKSFSLNYSADNNSTLVVYPASDFVVKPGETFVAYLYADSGVKEINYSVMEGGAVISNGTLMVKSSGLEGLTGFAVAAGSVLGIAGLIVLVLFIYFYFIRQPPSSDDEFKPVEVKKADLTRPQAKSDGKYW